MSKDSAFAGRGRRRGLDKEALWREVLRDFAASGQSVRAFCRQQQVSEPSFYAWRRAIARRDAASEAAGSAEPAFVPVRLARKRAPAAGAMPRSDSAPRAAESHPGTTSESECGTTASLAEVPPLEVVLVDGCRIRLRGPVDRATLIEVVAALRSGGVEG